MWRYLAIGLAILATALFILAVAVYYGYIPTTLVGSLTAGELGTFGFLSGAAAAGCEIAENRRK